ncbi:hypothetical protein GO009_07060 [Muricauda sp. TY007]|uniref:hypothetical protein n=1 Tax=Allomuricauda sp. TY007 TaxID=2683200 RepID=UPI0013C24C62|nr:hypothetical protein [Muricauda sp. TY007]NDV15783.1 hypothetical protein [Muricauda sp. TY007]
MSRYIKRNRTKFKKQCAAITVKSQFIRLKSSFPNLVEEEYSENRFSVVIKLRPDIFSKEYDVRIVYEGRATVDVFIVNEKLDVATNRDVLPHVFNHTEQKICLYSRTGGSWTKDKSIVSTIVPWASEWLYYYEHWLIDGEWKGGGHPEYEITDIEKIRDLDVK